MSFENVHLMGGVYYIFIFFSGESAGSLLAAPRRRSRTLHMEEISFEGATKEMAEAHVPPGAGRITPPETPWQYTGLNKKAN